MSAQASFCPARGRGEEVEKFVPTPVRTMKDISLFLSWHFLIRARSR